MMCGLVINGKKWSRWLGFVLARNFHSVLSDTRQVPLKAFERD